MKTTALKLCLIFIGFFITVAGFGQSYPIDARIKKVIDSTYTALLKKYETVGASIAIVDNGKLVYATGYGFSDQEKKTPATENTIYRIGSCTKSFTALSVMQLQEKGLLNVNNSVKNYLPELTINSRFNDNNEIFIKDMLCHTSGLPCDINNGFFCDAPPDINWVIAELNKQTTISPRLYMHAYSNVAYGLLGEVIARTSKTNYSNYVKQNIFNPLNMTSSYIETDEKLAVNFSKGYYKGKELKEPMIRDQAAGLIHSNAVDMANYLIMYLNKGKFNSNEIVSQASLAEMQKNQLINTQLSANGNTGYGLEIQTILIKTDKDSSTATMVGHGGDTFAFHADFEFIPELNVGAVILTNSDGGWGIVSASKLLKLYVKESQSKKIITNYKSPSAKTKDSTKEVLCSKAELLGKYSFGSFIVNARNTQKMKFKQGPATITFKQKKSDPNLYKVKAVVYHLIPIKINDQEFKFVKMNGDIYLKVVFTKTKDEEFAAIKLKPEAIPSSWNKALGTYQLTGSTFPCTKCPFMDTEGMVLTLSDDDGLVKMKTKGKTPDTKSIAYLTLLSDSMAVTGGIGRGNGETVRVLDNGNIYYSGYEFKKIK